MTSSLGILGVNGLRLIGQRSGVGRAIEAILANLATMDHPFSAIRVYTPAPLAGDVVLPEGIENVVAPAAGSLAAWEQLTLPKIHGDRDLLLCPSYVIPVLARCPTFLIHHGSYEGYPSAFSWWRRNRARIAYMLSARRASVVTTVSQHSKNDMVRFYGVRPEKIHVVPEGVDTRLFRPIRDPDRLSAWRRRALGEDVPFIVYVGKPVERRNLTPLIRAFAELRRNRALAHRLVIIGGDLPGDSPFREVIVQEGLGDAVKVLGYVGHEEMAIAYNAADLLVYPSSYEGFGMPVLEAMACGTPAIALDNTAFPEFAGGVAVLLANAEVSTLAEGIESVLLHPAQRERMAAEGPKRAALYDWGAVTKRYLELMVSYMREHRCAEAARRG